MLSLHCTHANSAGSMPIVLLAGPAHRSLRLNRDLPRLCAESVTSSCFPDASWKVADDDFARWNLDDVAVPAYALWGLSELAAQRGPVRRGTLEETPRFTTTITAMAMASPRGDLRGQAHADRSPVARCVITIPHVTESVYE